VNSPPKQGRKCGQSNTEATNTKRAKATTKSDVEGSGEEGPEAGKRTTKGKGGGKKGDGAVWVPNIVTFINIFIAKTQFYQVWKPTFLQAEEYPDMRDWLNEEEDFLAAEDLWDMRGSQVLGFPDLKKWLDKKDCEGELKKCDLEGERKAPDSPKKN